MPRNECQDFPKKDRRLYLPRRPLVLLLVRRRRRSFDSHCNPVELQRIVERKNRRKLYPASLPNLGSSVQTTSRSVASVFCQCSVSIEDVMDPVLVDIESDSWAF